MAWFLQLSKLSNTTQFSTFYYFLLQYYFSSPDIYYLLLKFNYFFFFILSHTHLLSSRFLHFIFLYFITSSSTLLYLHFAFLLVHNFYIFYQYQCAAMPLLKFWVSNFSIRFFFSCTGTFVHSISFSFEVFWFTECKFVLVLKTFFFLGTNFMPAESWISADIYRNTQNRPKWPEIFSQVK